MTAYRRNFVPGASYFFTVILNDRDSLLLTEHIAALRKAFVEVRRAHPFSVDAIVVLPEHLHAIWTLPDGDSNFPSRWRLIKSTFSRALPRKEIVSDSRLRKGERGIWQRRYWEHTLRDETDFARHVDYIHINPLRHGWVKRVRDWPYSSFHRHVAKGGYPADWGGELEIGGGGDGER